MKVEDRFLHYVTYDTQSNEASPDCPSTPGQKLLAQALVKEMQSMGIADAQMDENGYVYGHLAANVQQPVPAIGLIAHMDTAQEVSGRDVTPKVFRNYQGEVLKLGHGYTLEPGEQPMLLSHIGDTLITADGSTLLGGDDKAGIAEILTAVEQLIMEDTPHGPVCIAFTPDEEIGRGADRFDVVRFGADFAYTVDGGDPSDVEYENFNAASAQVTFAGRSIHPGSAKGRMLNAQLVAMEFHSMLPVFENPAFTEGYEGFSHLTEMQGAVEQATLHYIIRDHSRERFEERKERFEKIAAYLSEKYGAGTVKLAIQDSYYNMKEQLLPHPEILRRANEAIASVGLTPKSSPIRGGTDGARLSFMGLTCPNLGTGGCNGHGRLEFVSVRDMEKVVLILKHILTGLKV